MNLRRIYAASAKVYFVTATAGLLLLAFILLGTAIYDVALALAGNGQLSVRALESVGLLIIGFAIVETSTFIAEEEIFSKRELRSYSESRRSLTKFVTIIIIASSLEALVMIFTASRTDVSNSFYAALIFLAAMFALASLGAYQWLSSRIKLEGEEEKRGQDRDSGGG